MIDETPLGPGAEFDAIRQMLARWGDRASGIGDDAAVLRVPRGDALVASVDATVEGEHFRREWLSPGEIGYRAVTAALSDLAAMAAAPLGVLIALELPDAWRSDLDDLADGIGDAVDAAGTRVLGGNVSGGERLSITTTVLGSAFTVLTRRGAHASERVYVTGTFGGPGNVLERLRRGDQAGAHRERFARPRARLVEARWLAEQGASAAIDVSDGLLADLRHLAAASAARIEIDARRVPRLPGIEAGAAVSSGEEYELIVTSGAAIDCVAFERRFGIPLTEIGKVAAGPWTVVVHGARVADLTGYDHLSR
ncbi:MAG TPA: thiamine-phosphate kinase [Gemmatimonadaceae bacterium]|nr:thiamine-phosphate kinase [Gemmatimonadaceae bacterium]